VGDALSEAAVMPVKRTDRDEEFGYADELSGTEVDFGLADFGMEHPADVPKMDVEEVVVVAGPSVKSLEQRIDEMADDFASVKAQLGGLAASLSSFQAQLATLSGTLNAMQAQYGFMIARLDINTQELKETRTRLESMVNDYSAFRSKGETTFAMVRWIGVFVAGGMVTVILSAVSVARSAGSLEATVQRQQKTLDEIHREMSEMRGKLK
jgi:hypothetical protein